MHQLKDGGIDQQIGSSKYPEKHQPTTALNVEGSRPDTFDQSQGIQSETLQKEDYESMFSFGSYHAACTYHAASIQFEPVQVDLSPSSNQLDLGLARSIYTRLSQSEGAYAFQFAWTMGLLLQFYNSITPRQTQSVQVGLVFSLRHRSTHRSPSHYHFDRLFLNPQLGSQALTG